MHVHYNNISLGELQNMPFLSWTAYYGQYDVSQIINEVRQLSQASMARKSFKLLEYYNPKLLVNAVNYIVVSLVSLGPSLALFPWLRNNMLYCTTLWGHFVQQQPIKEVWLLLLFRAVSRDASSLCTCRWDCFMSGLPHALTRLTDWSSRSLLVLPFYFVLTGQILRRSGNKRSVVILGKTGLVSVNVPVRLWNAW